MTYQCLVSGKVQGVFYRSYVQKMASEAGFSGYVKNLPDGAVEACVTTDKEHTLEHFLEILTTGSPYSRVEHVKTQTIKVSPGIGFIIKR